jgi:hypothetical protein
MCAARFGAMNIRSLVVEKTARVGDVEATVRGFELSSLLFGANCSMMKLPKSLSTYSLLPFILCVNLFPMHLHCT